MSVARAVNDADSLLVTGAAAGLGASTRVPAPRRSRLSRTSHAAALTIASCALFANSCAKHPADFDVPLNASRSATTADENDIDAAVEVAVGRHEMAVVKMIRYPRDPHVVRRYELRTVTDEPVWLEVRRAGISSRNEPVELELRASVSAFGDAKREKALLESVTRRLNQLAGVRVAPIR
jgi:hypothetical protein